MREQERRRRSPDPASKGKGKSKKKAADDDGEEEAEGEEAEPVLQSDHGSSPTPPPAKRARKEKGLAKEPTAPKAPSSKAAVPTTGASRSKRTRTRSRATINIPPLPAEPVLHQEPAIDPQLEEYDAVAQAGYLQMEMHDYSMPAPMPDQMQAVSGWEPDLDLVAFARAYIQDNE